MALRKFGMSVLNESFGKDVINAVWSKGKIVSGVDPNKRRLDSCGAWIDYAQYGVTEKNGTGWEIDHIHPVSRGGKDTQDNLQPLQWENNRAKSDNLPGQWSCASKAK